MPCRKTICSRPLPVIRLVPSVVLPCRSQERSCDQSSCADAASCIEIAPEFCPHGLAEDEECTGACQHPSATPSTCDQATQPKPQRCQPSCAHCGKQQSKPGLPKTTEYRDKYQAPCPPKPASHNCTNKRDSAESAKRECCSHGSGKGIRSGPHIKELCSLGSDGSCCGGQEASKTPKRQTSEGNQSRCDRVVQKKNSGTGSQCPMSPCAVGQKPSLPKVPQCSIGSQTADNHSAKPVCPRTDTAQLFPLRARTPCLCRMPPAYNSPCTGNLAGNCRCDSCDKPSAP